jgi:co-chaperonin GroES (HSP10)
MVKVIPTKDFVLLRKVTKATAIVIPETAAEARGGGSTLYRFEVTAIGKGCREVKIGDTVISTVPRAVGSFEGVDGQIIYIAKEDEICAVIRG